MAVLAAGDAAEQPVSPWCERWRQHPCCCCGALKLLLRGEKCKCILWCITCGGQALDGCSRWLQPLQLVGYRSVS